MKRIISILFALTMVSTAIAQTDSTQKLELRVMGEVIDFLSQRPLDTLNVLVMENGKTLDTAKIHKMRWGQNQSVRFSFVVTRPGNYQLRIESPGFKSKYVPFVLDKMHKNEKSRNLPVIYMQKEKEINEVELDEVTVTATRLKFYMDGDTLVYDADAFQMAEGSMLEALIKRLPGVELESGGEIYANGKKVQELQLNGRELLDSDKELFLENLPAYMIKNVGVSEQVPKQYIGTPLENQVEKETIMNVKLKREYSKGWISNIEGGIGASMYDTDEFDPDKYLLRAFASRFSDNSRLSLFANINNLNDYRDPGEQGSWTPLQQSTGLMETYKLGVTGSRYTTGDVLRYMGSGNVTYTDSDNDNRQSSERFLEQNGESANTYGRSATMRTSYDTRINTEHRLMYTQRTKPVFNALKNVFANVSLSGNYHKYSNNSTNASAELDKDVREDWGKEWLDSLLSPFSGDLLKIYGINRTITRQHGEGHDTKFSFSGTSQASPQYNDRLSFGVNASYNFADQSTPNFEHYTLEYFKKSDANTLMNRYNDNFSENHNAVLGTNISYALDHDMKHNLQLRYNYNYSNVTTNQSRYLLHLLDAWNNHDTELGMLPSMSELATTLDKTNSSYSHSIVNKQTPNLTYSFRKRSENGGSFNINASLDVPITDERIDYQKGTIDTELSRKVAFLQPTISFRKNNWNKGFSLNLTYNLTYSTPSLTDMVDIEDNSNPLQVVHGNPDLKNATKHNVRLQYRDTYAERIQLNSSFRFQSTYNAQAMGYTYDRETGIRVMMPENVDGNWSLTSQIGAAIPFDKDQRYVLNPSVKHSFTNSVDLSSTSLTPVKSIVGTHNLENSLSFDMKIVPEYTINLNGALTYRNSTSDREGFQEINSKDFHYGILLQADIFGGFQISTDLNMYSRRGYSSSEMNSNELVWNARISKSIMKGRLTIMLDAFDLLHNLSNVRYSVNAQGRTETINNVIPSYALLRLRWRFTKNNGDKSNTENNGGINRGGMPNGGGNRGGGFGGNNPGGGRPPMK